MSAANRLDASLGVVAPDLLDVCEECGGTDEHAEDCGELSVWDHEPDPDAAMEARDDHDHEYERGAER